MTLERGAPVAERPLFFEHLGWRAVRQGRWKLVSKPRSDVWELYDIQIDPSESHDLREVRREIAFELERKWVAWAGRVQAEPADMNELMRLYFPSLAALQRGGTKIALHDFSC